MDDNYNGRRTRDSKSGFINITESANDYIFVPVYMCDCVILAVAFCCGTLMAGLGMPQCHTFVCHTCLDLECISERHMVTVVHSLTKFC